VVLEELTDEQEGIDGRKAVGEEAGGPLYFVAGRLGNEGVVPEGGKLLVVLLQLAGQLLLALLQLFEVVEDVVGFSDW
jgi:hypothetical protein